MGKQTRAAMAVGAIVVLALASLFSSARAREDDGTAAAGEMPAQENAVVREDSRILVEDGTRVLYGAELRPGELAVVQGC